MTTKTTRIILVLFLLKYSFTNIVRIIRFVLLLLYNHLKMQTQTLNLLEVVYKFLRLSLLHKKKYIMQPFCPPERSLRR